MSVVLKPDAAGHAGNPTRGTTQAPPSAAATLSVLAVTAVITIFFGLTLWAFLLNDVGPHFSP
jgi:hypothetical protein